MMDVSKRFMEQCKFNIFFKKNDIMQSPSHLSDSKSSLGLNCNLIPEAILLEKKNNRNRLINKCDDDNETETDPTLNVILTGYSKYIEDNWYVYKRFANNRIVIMRYLSGKIQTITNEHRTRVVDERYAKFRGNLFKVILIFGLIDPTKTFSSAYSMNEPRFKYVVERTVTVNNFDSNPDTIFWDTLF